MDYLNQINSGNISINTYDKHNNDYIMVDNKQEVSLLVNKTDKSYCLSMKLTDLQNSKLDLQQLLE